MPPTARLPALQRTRSVQDFYQQRASFTTWLLRRRGIIKCACAPAPAMCCTCAVLCCLVGRARASPAALPMGGLAGSCKAGTGTTACKQQSTPALPCPALQAAVPVCRALGGRQPGGGAAPGGGRCVRGAFCAASQAGGLPVMLLVLLEHLLLPALLLFGLPPPARPPARCACSACTACLLCLPALPVCLPCRGGGPPAGGAEAGWHRGGAHHLRLPVGLPPPAGAAARLLGAQQQPAARHGRLRRPHQAHHPVLQRAGGARGAGQPHLAAGRWPEARQGG